MTEGRKSTWRAPKLIVVGHAAAEEAVLTNCKGESTPLGPGYVEACYRVPAIEACNTLGTS